jgi:hypothetical protein
VLIHTVGLIVIAGAALGLADTSASITMMRDVHS